MRRAMNDTSRMQRAGYWLGMAWIAVSAIYFYTHFAYIFYDANRAAIQSAFAKLFGGF